MTSRRRGRAEFEEQPSSDDSKRGRVAAGDDRRDRFVPNRSAMGDERGPVEDENALVEAADGSSECNLKASSQSEAMSSMNAALASSLCASGAQQQRSDLDGQRVLAFRNKAPAPAEGYTNSLKVLYSQGQASRGLATARPTRHISTAPERMLDAPGLLDDYYLNLLSWGSNNLLAVALGPVVYIWDPVPGQITDLPALEVMVIEIATALRPAACVHC